MARYNQPRQFPRVTEWDAARPTGVIVDHMAPSYMPIPYRPPPNSPPGTLLAGVKTANLIVSTNNSTYVQPGPVQDQMTSKLSEHRANIELNERRVRDVERRRSRECWNPFRREDPVLEEVREKTLNLYDDIEVYAAETTSSASKYPKGNITFQHPTFADPYIVPQREARTTRDGSDDGEDDGDDEQGRHALSTANGDWGSVRRERGPLRVMNPGTTATSTSMLTWSESGSSADWSNHADAGYPAVNRRAVAADSQQHLTAHAAPPPQATFAAQAYANANHSYPPAPPSAGYRHQSGWDAATSGDAPRATQSRHTGHGGHLPSSSERTSSTIRAPPSAHVRQGTGSGHSHLYGRSPTYRSGVPPYESCDNRSPEYADMPSPLEPTIMQNSSIYRQYEAATYNVWHGRGQFPAGPSRR